MTFTSTPPTTPGWFAWKQPDGQMGSLYLNQSDLDCRLTMTAFERMKLEWCRLVPANEVVPKEMCKHSWFADKSGPGMICHHCGCLDIDATRLVPAKEIESLKNEIGKAWIEGAMNQGVDINEAKLRFEWLNSRAKRIMEGKE